MTGPLARPVPQTRPEKIDRGQAAGVALLIVIAGVIVVVLWLLLRTAGGSEEPYSTISSAPSGLLGLRLWLEDMGYKVVVGDAPEAAKAADVIFLFPDTNFTGDQVRRLSQRVEDGATVVFAGADLPELSRTFGALIQRRDPFSDTPLRLTQPILPVEAELAGKAVSGRTLSTMPGMNLTPVLVTPDGRAAVLVEQRGQGTVWHVGLARAFTNVELAGGWGRVLVLAALRGKPSGSTVYIVNGEVQGQSGQPVSGDGGQIDGLGQWMLRHPIGWAGLLLAGLLLFYLFTQGRRLGPALIQSDPHRRRAAVEHIQAMANLAQAAGHRDAVARYQKARLKRRLGQAWRVSSELDDAAFVSALNEASRLTPDKTETLTNLLAQLDRVRDEHDLVALVDVASRFTLE